MKVRIDQYLVEKKLAPNLEAARAILGAGEVLVGDTLIDKAGTLIDVRAEVRIKERGRYVSRGGLKLAHGLSQFHVNVSRLICLDIGASTGGFTDCLLQNGALKVYAIDVAYGQLAWKIRQDKRVVVIERFNARKLCGETVNNDDIQFAVIDVSFISLTKVLPAVIATFPGGINIIALVKPQFELPKTDISPGGVIVDPQLHNKAIFKVKDFIKPLGLVCRGVVQSPILGPKGNTEFLIHLSSDNDS